MPLEYSYLVAAVIVFSIHILAEAVAGNLQYNLKDLAGARDDLPEPNAAVGRCKRASQNMLEALILFAPLVIVAVETGRTNGMTELGAGIFLGARILYAPSYWFGIPWLRTLVWFAGIIGTVMVLLQVLPFSGAA
ncbi:MAG: MAPEG family protein [Pseudomonadota bacterium]